jgi:hypothetical protein
MLQTYMLHSLEADKPLHLGDRFCELDSAFRTKPVPGEAAKQGEPK